MSKPKINIFVSYSSDPDDDPFFEVFIKGLSKHLFVSSSYDFGVWDESKALPGSSWDKEIEMRLAEADLAILCVSAGFLGSDNTKIREFETLLKKHTDTVIIPVYFNHCNFTVWEELAGIQFFKPTGEKYGKGPDDDFAFCDLVELSMNNGVHIALPDAKRDRYFRDFAEKVEEVLAAKSAIEDVQPLPPGDETARYINPDNYPYFEKDNFFGREDLLKEIDDKLKKLDLPLLISGIGGMGKTAVAVAYGKEVPYCNGYNNIAWVNVTDTIFSNLFSTFQGNTVIPFEYSADGDRRKDVEHIMQLLKKVPGQNLLLIDNANEEKELQEFIEAWKKYMPGWKCIITTRSENSAYRKHLIQLQVISPEAAAELFKTHNTEEFDDDSFKAIYEYIGGHTFLIELLAKYGQESSLVNGTKEILAYLKSKGIKALNRAVLAGQGQHEKTDRLVSEFVMGLYDPLTLKEKEKEYLRYFSVLPAADFELLTLVRLFGIAEEEKDNFDNTLNTLYKKGWLIHSGSTFKCHQIIQEINREKLMPDTANCMTLIENLYGLFESSTTTQAVPFFETGLLVFNNLSGASHEYAILGLHLSDRVVETGNVYDALGLLEQVKEIFSLLNNKNEEATCLERMGDIYSALGNRAKTFSCYQQYNALQIELVKEDPEDIHLVDGLAISYSRLGNLYIADGNRQEALRCYQQFNLLENDLADKNPDNVELKNGLAISFSKLGDLYRADGNGQEALKYYNEDLRLTKEIAEKNPDNVKFKNNLAVSFSKLGDLYREDGNWEEALRCYQQFNLLENDLANKNPDNVQFKNNLAISYERLGDSYQKEENKQEVLRCYQQSHLLKTELAEKNPDNVQFKNGLAISFSRLGNLYIDDGNWEEALSCYQQFNLLENDLANKNPDNVEFKNNLAVSFSKLGNLYIEGGNIEEALRCYQQYNLLENDLVNKNPENVGFKNNLAISYTKLGSLTSTSGKKDYYQKAKEIWEALVTKVPQVIEYKRNLDWVNDELKNLE
jgi:tetratricopeptide (TPR) repeat protein